MVNGAGTVSKKVSKTKKRGKELELFTIIHASEFAGYKQDRTVLCFYYIWFIGKSVSFTYSGVPTKRGGSIKQVG